MVEQICIECRHRNPMNHEYCGRCGIPLTHYQIIPRPESRLTIAGRDLPARQLKQIGQTVAVSLLALAAEAGLAWLRRRVREMQEPLPSSQSLSAVLPKKPDIVSPSQPLPNRTAAVFGRRITRIWQRGQLTEETIEIVAWQHKERP